MEAGKLWNSGLEASEGAKNYRHSAQRKRLRRFAGLGKLVDAGFSVSWIYEFLAPLIPERGLTWRQVYLEVRQIKLERELREKSKAEVKLKEDSSVSPISTAVAEQTKVVLGPGRTAPAEPSVAPVPTKKLGTKFERKPQQAVPPDSNSVSVVGSDSDSPVVSPGVESGDGKRENGLSKLFGPLPEPGTIRVDQFLSSPQAAKLRSGAFWRQVAELAGAEFYGPEFGGLGMRVSELGNLPLWCEEFALDLTRALGFRDSPFVEIFNHPDQYKTFSPYILVMGHLLVTFRSTSRLTEELLPYFLRTRLPLGKYVSLGTIEAGLYEYVGKPGVLATSAVGRMMDALGGAWWRASKTTAKDKDVPWRTEDKAELFLSYAKVFFARPLSQEENPDWDLELELKKELFMQGSWEQTSGK